MTDDNTPTVEPDSVPDVVPDVTPDTPAEEAPAVPDAPKEDTPVPDAGSKVETLLETVIEKLDGLGAAITASVPVAGLPESDESPTPPPWTHRGLGKRHD